MLGWRQGETTDNQAMRLGSICGFLFFLHPFPLYRLHVFYIHGIALIRSSILIFHLYSGELIVMTVLSSDQRQDIFQELTAKELDVLVIGGGITGAGIALDAVTLGMKVGLVEMQDFAAGTSSRSTKLVHGGLRYLKQLEVKMVADVGKERAIVYENGPHVTSPEWMMLPFHKGGTFGPFTTN